MSSPSIVEKMVCAGSAACIADVTTFPFDVAKVRLQIAGEQAAVSATSAAVDGTAALSARAGLFGTLIHLSKTEGVKSLWGGIGPGLQRQCVFASIRIGIYEDVRDFYASRLPESCPIVLTRIASGITTGAIAISFAQPTDVVKIKMQAQSRPATSGAAAKTVMYKNSLHAYKTIYRTEGLKGLWKGLGPNIARNSVVNAAELVCYDTIKDSLIKHKILNDGIHCHFSAAFGAGFIATLVASPIDVVKTRYMNSTKGQYTGIFDATRQLVQKNGLRAFYAGFTPSFMRLGTWNVVMFVSFEQLKILSTHIKSNQIVPTFSTAAAAKCETKVDN